MTFQRCLAGWPGGSHSQVPTQAEESSWCSALKVCWASLATAHKKKSGSPDKVWQVGKPQTPLTAMASRDKPDRTRMIPGPGERSRHFARFQLQGHLHCCVTLVSLLLQQSWTRLGSEHNTIPIKECLPFPPTQACNSATRFRSKSPKASPDKPVMEARYMS